MKIKVLIADDQVLIQKGIEVMLEDVGEIQLVGFANNASEALELVDRKSPDILILDVEMPGMDGLALTRQLVNDCIPIKIIVLSSYEKVNYISSAIDAGAMGYLSKSAITEDLSWAIQLVYRGYSAFKTDLLQIALKERESILTKCQEKIVSLEEDLYRQRLKPPRRSRMNRASRSLHSFLERLHLKTILFLPIVYLRKNKSIAKLTRKFELIISNSIERILKRCDRFWR